MNQMPIELKTLPHNMAIAIQLNLSERAVEVIILLDGMPVMNGGVRLTVPQAKEHAQKLVAAIQYLEQQKTGGLILPPGVGRPFQP